MVVDEANVKNVEIIGTMGNFIVEKDTRVYFNENV